MSKTQSNNELKKYEPEFNDTLSLKGKLLWSVLIEPMGLLTGYFKSSLPVKDCLSNEEIYMDAMFSFELESSEEFFHESLGAINLGDELRFTFDKRLRRYVIPGEEGIEMFYYRLIRIERFEND